MYQTILFDLDGTITDPGLGITNSVMYSLEKYNIKVEDRSELYKFIGPPLHESYAKYYGFSEEKAFKAVEYYREYFRDKGIYENVLYEGFDDLLKQLKNEGYTIVLATSKPQEFAVRILEYFNIDKYFDCIAGASMDGQRSKKIDVMKYALEMSNTTDMSEAIMIGDREYDILGAKHFGMDSVGVLFGYGSREELESAGATYIAENVKDIMNILKNK